MIYARNKNENLNKMADEVQ